MIKKFASRPRTPSTDTTKGVNDARRRAAASEYFFFFASSAEAETTRYEWDGASVSVTRPSNNATLPYWQGGVRSKSKKVHVSKELGERRGGMRRGV